VGFSSTPLAPNAGTHLPPEAAATQERRLEAVRFRVKAPVTRRPPHRSGRAQLTHPVPQAEPLLPLGAVQWGSGDTIGERKVSLVCPPIERSARRRLSGRALARAVLGREFPISTLSIVERVPSPTITHVSSRPP
jgi:hypothetical protein